ncbi:MAG: hypothetical protein KL863_06150 [Rhizobium sp.]|jgi:hypothetical protein|nr:hypothetical protein [Rhizobium sp.]MBX9455633.1 hypothetical protein [Rhizobium sp.]
MEVLLNVANILYVLAYFTLDMMRLRILTITAAVCLAIYFYGQADPMLNVVCWNLFFIALNVVQIARMLIASRRPTAP